MKAWYAVYTHARMEKWARSNLWERGFEVYLPLYLKRRRHARRVDLVEAPLFPRYLFVEADLEAGHKPRIATAPGVGYVVTFGQRPARVAPGLIDEIRAREGEDGFVQLRDRLRAGEPVRVERGALGDQLGLFDRVRDAARVVVLLNLLGRQVRVTVPADAVSRVA